MNTSRTAKQLIEVHFTSILEPLESNLIIVTLLSLKPMLVFREVPNSGEEEFALGDKHSAVSSDSRNAVITNGSRRSKRKKKC